jgi:acylphosphatase
VGSGNVSGGRSQALITREVAEVSTAQRQRREVYYSGRVQGVGFRYTVCALARKYAVTGYVRNLTDGRVYLLVEGETDAVAGFLHAIQKEMQHYIAGTHEMVGAASGQFDTFGIRY